MDERQLTDWIAGRLELTHFPTELWKLIPEDVREHVRDEEDRELLLSRASGLVEAARMAADGRLDLDADLPAEPEASEELERLAGESGEYERERALAYSEYRAALAAEDPGVRRFRERHLGGEHSVLAPREAERFLANGRNVGSLTGISRRLARANPWTEEQAAWFVLTAEAPEIAPITGRIDRRAGKAHTYGTITLDVEPWVSPDIVRDTYVRSQKKALGRNNRRIGARSLALFRFVVGQVERIRQPNLRERGARQKSAGRKGWGPPTELTGPSWRDMWTRWNDLYPAGHDWHYKDVQNFYRDFRNAERLIANPVKP